MSGCTCQCERAYYVDSKVCWAQNQKLTHSWSQYTSVITRNLYLILGTAVCYPVPVYLTVRSYKCNS